MTSGRSTTHLLWPTLMLAALLAPGTRASELDPDALIGRLARPAPARVAFTEVRLSPLLRDPLIVSGELSHSGPASLDRSVTQPYSESTAIRGESVRVEREGESARSFALKRAPQLRGLLAGFSALLSGDAKDIRRSFSVAVKGNEQAWTLQLTPLDKRVQRRLERIEVSGHDDVPRCFTLLNVDGGASVMLLGEAAGEELPDDLTIEALRRQCLR